MIVGDVVFCKLVLVDAFAVDAADVFSVLINASKSFFLAGINTVCSAGEILNLPLFIDSLTCTNPRVPGHT